MGQDSRNLLERNPPQSGCQGHNFLRIELSGLLLPSGGVRCFAIIMETPFIPLHCSLPTMLGVAEEKRGGEVEGRERAKSNKSRRAVMRREEAARADEIRSRGRMEDAPLS